MNIGAGIFKILGDDTTLVTDYLGGDKRIYPNKAPQLTPYPYIVYQKVNSEANETKSGVSTLDVIRMQFDFYHDNNGFDENYEIAERVRVLLDGYRGTIANVNIDSCIFLNDNDTWEEEDDINRISVDYSFRIQRTATISTGDGSIETKGWKTQKFSNVTGTTLTVTVGDLPTNDIDLNLEVYRDGILLINGVNMTISGNVITPSIPFTNENFLIKFKPA